MPISILISFVIYDVLKWFDFMVLVCVCGVFHGGQTFFFSYNLRTRSYNEIIEDHFSGSGKFFGNVKPSIPCTSIEAYQIVLTLV